MTHVQERIYICISKIIQQNPQLKNIFDEIYQQGGRVLLVGGAVRDCLLGCLGSDLDFEIYHLPFEQLQDILEKFGKTSFVGKSFGVLRLHGLDADWSIPRIDSAGRKPSVQLDPDMSFDQAFRRRDVTVNSIGIDVCSQELIDPYDGYLDLQKKILRSADVTFFVQDPLRLFRVMQFAARFEMTIDETLSQVCRTMDISEISVERIEKEFNKLFTQATKPSIGFAWLAHIGRLADFFPGVRFDNHFYQRLDCIAQHHTLSNQQKIVASWALIAQGLQADELRDISVDQKIEQQQLAVIVALLKKYIGSSDIIQAAALLSWYVRYVQLLVQQENQILCKWLAYWTDTHFSMHFLSDVSTCWYTQEQVEQFVCMAKNAKVLYKAEEPLLAGADLLSHAQGKELGDLLKKAYEIQIQESIHDKQKLLSKVIKNKAQ